MGAALIKERLDKVVAINLWMEQNLDASVLHLRRAELDNYY